MGNDGQCYSCGSAGSTVPERSEPGGSVNRPSHQRLVRGMSRNKRTVIERSILHMTIAENRSSRYPMDLMALERIRDQARVCHGEPRRLENGRDSRFSHEECVRPGHQRSWLCEWRQRQISEIGYDRSFGDFDGGDEIVSNAT